MNNQQQENQAQQAINKPSLLKQMSSRITFFIGAVIGMAVSFLIGQSIAIGILFGGAGALTFTTILAPNKPKKEKIVLGGAMLAFWILGLIGVYFHQA